MAKKKTGKKGTKKKTKKPTELSLEVGQLLEEISDAQRELNRIQERVAGLRPLCLRVRVLEDKTKAKGKHK